MKKLIRHTFINIAKPFIMRIFNHYLTLIPNWFTHFFLPIIAFIIQTCRTSQKLVTLIISRWKQTLSKKIDFPENLTAFKFCLAKHHHTPFLLPQSHFFNPTIGMPMPPAYQNTLIGYQYFFNYRSNMHLKHIYWN